MTSLVDSATVERDAFERLLHELRPRLHRYCARMTGSVLDGEDVVQDALLKAVRAHERGQPIAQPERWLFRIAHNAALDHLRARARTDASRIDQDPDTVIDPNAVHGEIDVVATSLRTFMRLPPVQRSTVILMDVLGYTLREIGEIVHESISAVKSALHRGRTRLRELATEPDTLPVSALSETTRALLEAYVDRFNARDFDAVRSMLADEVRLDVVARARFNGRRQVDPYFGNYAREAGWSARPGYVDDHPAVLIDEANGDAPAYFILLTWGTEQVVAIRDFRHAPYAVEGARVRADRGT